MRPLQEITSTRAAQEVFSLAAEFRKFAFKGNVIDLAVGVIIGATFQKIVDSLVKHIIMPAISLLMPSNLNYSEWKFVVGSKEILYGQFLGEVLNFLIVSFVLFLFVVKFLGWVMKNRKAEAAAPPPPTREQELLMEIRDLLKNRPITP